MNKITIQKELQQQKKQIENNITRTQWLKYAKALCESEQDEHAIPITMHTKYLLSIDDITHCIRRLATGQVIDIDGLQDEYLKRVLIFLYLISIVFSTVPMRRVSPKIGQPVWWSRSTKAKTQTTPLTIGPSRSTLFSASYLEAWQNEKSVNGLKQREKEQRDKQALDRSTPLLMATLRYLVEKIWDTPMDEVFCCFMDFQKAFDTIPCRRLWKKVEELGIPMVLRTAIHRLYKLVKAKYFVVTQLTLNILLSLGQHRDLKILM